MWCLLFLIWWFSTGQPPIEPWNAAFVVFVASVAVQLSETD